jgi:hypothetical protein
VTVGGGAVDNYRPGNIYFVSTGGNDSSAGGFGAPWRTLLKAKNTMGAGDIT